MKNFIQFWNIWIKDIFLELNQLFRYSHLKSENIKKHREPVSTNTLYVEIHEWGGYECKRIKRIKGIVEFEVGLDYQLNRFNSYKGDYNIDIYITMSEMHKCNNLKSISEHCNHLLEVSNIGMDFSGYSEFFKKIKDQPNAYVILTNTSVNMDSENCIDSMINYLENNPDVGMLGASSSSRYYHTLMRWNFNPHLQSFFLLTTIEVLKEAIDRNGGEFPGIHETNKHLLIRNGEVKLSKLILDLGYNLAVVNEHGVFKFNNSSYPLPKGDYRHFTNMPNKLYSVKL